MRWFSKYPIFEYKQEVPNTNYIVSVVIVRSKYWELGIINAKRGNVYSDPVPLFNSDVENAENRAKVIFDLAINLLQAGQTPRQVYKNVYTLKDQGKI